MNLQKKKIIIDNTELNYLEGGKGDSIVFLHGLSLRAISYRKSLEKLAETYHVLAPDMFGFGASTNFNPKWDFKDYTKQLEILLAEKNITNCVAIGHSLGGRQAVSLTANSKRVTKLMLIDSSPGADYYKKRNIYAVMIPLNSILEAAMRKNFSYLPIIGEAMRNSTVRFRELIPLRNAILHALRTDYNEFEKIHVPALILWGKNDKVISLHNAYDLQKKIKNAIVLEIDGDHAWPLTEPQTLFDIVNRFLKQDQV